MLKGLTIRGSIGGTRRDLLEALIFHNRGVFHPAVATGRLEELTDVLDEMRQGRIDDRVVITDSAHPLPMRRRTGGSPSSTG